MKNANATSNQSNHILKFEWSFYVEHCWKQLGTKKQENKNKNIK